jgi:hypothetical protein
MQWPLCRLLGFSPSRTAARTLGYVLACVYRVPKSNKEVPKSNKEVGKRKWQRTE